MKINTLVIVRDSIQDSVVSSFSDYDSSVLVINTDFSVKDFTTTFKNYLNYYMVNMVDLDSLYRKIKQFELEHFVFETDGQFIDLRNFFGILASYRF